MYPNGPWKGFWQQTSWGRQEMEQFELRFAADGTISGRGTDVVGVFVFKGTYDTGTGQLTMTKKYIGKHEVNYLGKPDGEGRIVGTWDISGTYTGPFSLQPVVACDEPIYEIVR